MFLNIRKFVLQYLNTDDRKNAGYELINKYAVGYQGLVISNTETSNNYEDYCFFYTADAVPQKFKIGRDYQDSLS